MGRFILRKARPRKDGRVSLTFSGHVNGHRLFSGTGINVRPADWDSVRQQVRRTDPNYAHINARLRELEAWFEREVAALNEPTVADIERLRRSMSRRADSNDASPQNEELTFWTGFAQFLHAKSTDRGERTIAKYRTLEKILREFERSYGRLTYEALTHDFYDAFKRFLIEGRKLTNNTVGKYVSTLKTYLAWADERGAAVQRDFRKFKVDEEDVEVVALTWEELQRIEQVDLSANPRLDRVRDLFVFACYTGARFGDVQRLNFDDIRESTWFLRMNKTKSDTRIYLIPQSLAIIEKYRAHGSLPLISSQRMNDYLKELGQLAAIVEPVRIVRYMGAKRIDDRGPKWQFMTSHTARRTFVTLSLERGMRPEVLMTLTGHRSFKTMKRYIAHTERSRQEEMERVWGATADPRL